MTKLLFAILGASLGIAAGAGYAGDAKTTQAWSDSKVQAAMSKCEGLAGTEAARCIVNISPQGGGRSTASAVGDENVVKAGVPTEEEYMSAMKHCDSAEVTDKDRCVADVKDRYGRM